MICARCGAVVANDRKFCGDCGTPLPWRCGACGSDNPADKRFCGDCGAPRGVSPRAAPQVGAVAPLPERRMLSVMFIDVVGSTAIGARLDPEDFREVMAAFRGVITGLVTQFGGFIARHMGDGALVYFGYPQAHEVDAERAIRAGLTIIEAVARLSTAAGPPGTLNVRIGIDTGFVIVGDLIGSGASLETAVVGDTPNLAARLQAAAEPGTIVISDATRLLIGGLFEYRELVLSNLKGRREVERAWVVLGEGLIDSRYEALRGGQSLIVNRTEELELLLRRWEQSRAGDGRIVLLTGEPGIGKSRLIAELERYVGAAPHQLLRFLCSPHHLDTPLRPVIQFMERAANFQRGDSPAAKWEKLTNVLPPDISLDDKALLADLLSIPSEVRSVLNDLTPQVRKAMTFVTMFRQLDRLVRQNPTLAIVEDIHWADPSSLELLDHLVEILQQLPMLLVITARPEVHPAWAARPYVTVQLLSGLDHPTAVSLIKQVVGERELPREVIDRIIVHSDNVPLFIEELTKTVLKRLQDRHGEHASPLQPLSADVVPTSLYSSLMERLDRSSAGKEIAQIGAVIGRDFSFDTIQALSPLPAAQLENVLTELAQAGIIVAHGQPPDATYTFKHALVQDAAYASLLRDRRQAIHLRLAEEMEKDATIEATELPLIAWHFAEARAPDKAIDYYQKAAEHATGRFALTEMVNHLQNGLRQITLLPESPARNRRELALQLALGRALIDQAGGASDAVRVTFERARELCFSLDEMTLLPRVYDGLIANYHYIRSNPEQILKYADEIISVHSRTGDPQALVMLKRAGALANFLLGRFALAREDMQALIEMYDARRDGPQAGTTTRDPKVAMMTFLGVCLSILGQFDSGAAKTRAGIDYAKTLNHPVSLNLALRRACVQGMLLKDTQRVAECSNELAALRAAYETYQGGWEGTFFQDWAQLRMRSDPVRLDRVRAFLDHLDRARIWALLPFYMASVAELVGEHGDGAAAAALVERADELVNIGCGRWCEAEVLRLRARFCARNQGEAAALLHAGLVKAREQNAKLWELRTATDLAALLRDQGNLRYACEVLRPICEWISEGRDESDYIAARALLDDIEKQHRRAANSTPNTSS